MFADDLLPATLRDDPTRLEVRLNWYRSLPLSCVEAIELTLDGEPVPATLRVDGPDGWWPVLQPGELLLGDVAPGEHEVEVAITLRIPYYGPLPDDSFVTITDRARRTVTA